MFKKIIVKCLSKKWELLLLTGIILIGIFFRTYHFSDWLLFEIDQSYDTRIVSHAIESGIGELPLLGPTAGGGRALRLGPAFYYMEYASALVFGNTPTGHALLVLILSILAIPLFYIFIRKYFDITLSLALLTLFSLSVYLVLYGRFSWSPNVLPFLILLSFYALLRSVSEIEEKRDRWFLIATAAIAVTSQIHFNAFFTIPTIAILFLLYKRPHFKLKTWIIAIGIVTLVYSPMILNDLSTHGENLNFFLKKISKNGSPINPFKDILRKLSVDLNYNASGYFFINSGIDRINGDRIKEYGFQDDANLPWRILATALFLAQLFFLVRNIVKENIGERKDFLVLILLWVLVPFAYFYSLISNNLHIYPRFYLLIAPAAIILFGFLLEKLQPKNNALQRIVLVTVILTFLFPNLWRTYNHFLQLADPKINRAGIETEDIFPNDKRLTSQETLAIVDFMVSKQKENGYPLYLNTYHEYEPVFWYYLNKQAIPYSDKIDFSHLYKEGNYFLIHYPQDGTAGIEKIFSIVNKEKFGVLTVYTLTPKDENVQVLRQSPNDRKQLEQTMQIQELKTWNDLLR